jgi:uncharacterized protein with HEPN domain
MSRDRVHLLYIQRNIANIQRLVGDGKEDFLADEDKQAAILYYLQTLSESTTRLSEELREAQPHIAWQQIRGFRNRVVHDYLSVDLELVWLIITNELVPLGAAIDALLADLPAEDDE